MVVFEEAGAEVVGEAVEAAGTIAEDAAEVMAVAATVKVIKETGARFHSRPFF
jgi:hypothetical protein